MSPSAAEAVAAFQSGRVAHARELAQHVLEAEPGSPVMLHLLGLIECQSGRIGAGLDWLRQAFEAEPGNLHFRIMFARALIDIGRAEDALAVAEPPNESGPADLDLWLVRAEAAHHIGRFDLASEAWRAICSARPAEASARTNLARSLLAQNLFAEAEAAYRQALDIEPANPAALYELGITLERTNQLDGLGELLERTRELGIAREQFADLWSVHELRSGRPERARSLLQTVRPGEDPVRWNHLRAKAAEACGHPAEAFAAALAMNRAVPGYQDWREQSATFREELRRLARAITPEWAGRVRQLPSDGIRNVAFLVGFPRSGTTLLDTFLMGHPDCRVIEEQPMLLDAARALGPTDALPDCTTSALRRARDTYTVDLQRRLGDDVGGLAIDKFPLNLLAAPLIHSLFPAAPIIFVQRHPCDAVLSAFMQNFAPSIGIASFLDIRDAAGFYDCVMSVWTASEQAFALRAHVVRYEELVTEPERTLRPLMDFLGLGWDDRLLDHQATARKRETLRNTSYDQVVEPLTTKARGRWTTYREQLEPVLQVLLPWAERLGYRD